MGITDKTRGKKVIAAMVLDHGTKTATGGAATLNKMSGIITTASLTTAADGEYTLTITSDKIAAADIVLVSIQYGTCSQGVPIAYLVTPATGSVVIKVQNNHASAAFNGTLKIAFAVLKAS